MAATSTSGSTGGGGEGGALPGNCSGETIVWAKQLGGTGNDRGWSLAPDGQGGLFVSGLFDGTLNLGTTDLTTNGFDDVFVAHFDETGVSEWSFSYGNLADDPPLRLYSTPDGGFVAAGSFKGTVDFGDGEMVPADGKDAIVLRYNSAGELLWKKPCGGPGTQDVNNAAVDPLTGDVYIVGLFHNEIDLTEEVLTSAGDSDGFIAKLDADGVLDWRRQIGGTEADYAYAVALDDTGQLLTGGATDGDVDLGMGTELTSGSTDGWAGLYDSATGDAIWARRWATTGYQQVREAAFTAAGGAMIAGRFQGQIQLDSLPQWSFGAAVFVARLDQTGAITAASPLGNVWDVTALQLKPDGNFLVSGWFDDELGTEPLPIPSAGLNDGMIIELDAALDPSGTIVLGSSGSDAFSSMAIVSGSDVYSIATFSGVASLADCDHLTPVGIADMVLVKLAP
ncbi:MAG: hypothetical protein HOV80_08465 [Polyangiaceae bacterium]|nr:hypothetical protein [Polyangiaceae bacterium]